MALRPKERFTQRAIGNLAATIVVAKTADESVTSSTALQDDDALVLAIGAGETWLCEFLLDIGALLSTTGLKLAVTVPSGAAVNVSASCIPAVVTSLDQLAKRSAVAGGTLTFAAANLAAVTDGQFTVLAYVANAGTAGNITLQFAQATSSGTAVTVRAGSFLWASKLAP